MPQRFVEVFKIASAGREAPCWRYKHKQKELLFWTRLCAWRITVSYELYRERKTPSAVCITLMEAARTALCSDRLCRTTTIWWPAQSASGLHSERLDHFNKERRFWHRTAAPASWSVTSPGQQRTGSQRRLCCAEAAPALGGQLAEVFVCLSVGVCRF